MWKRTRMRGALSGGLIALAVWGSTQFALGANATASYCTRATGETPRVCNCSHGTVTVQICNKDEVEVQVGSTSYGFFKTGQSTTTCVTEPLEPMTCGWLRYYFQCCHDWLGGWNCTYEHSSVMDGAAGTSDCN